MAGDEEEEKVDEQLSQPIEYFAAINHQGNTIPHR
jgi:hypothetical protein